MKKSAICKSCGKPFTSYNPNPSFCSKGCYTNAQRFPIDDQKVIELYNGGLSQRGIVEALCSTRKVIENVFKRNGIKGRKTNRRNQYGENNPMWSGDSPSYKAAHKRLTRKFGQPNRCDVCGTTDPSKTYDWANLTGNYADTKDYKRMCRSCHWKHDDTHLNFTRGKSDEKAEGVEGAISVHGNRGRSARNTSSIGMENHGDGGI